MPPAPGGLCVRGGIVGWLRATLFVGGAGALPLLVVTIWRFGRVMDLGLRFREGMREHALRELVICRQPVAPDSLVK